MVGWIILGILGCIILLFVLLLTVHAHVTIDYKDDFALSVKVLGIRFPILPKKQKTYKLKDYTLKKIRKREEKAKKQQAKDARKKALKAAEKAKKKAEEKRLTKAQKRAIKKRKKASRPAVGDLIPLVGRVAKLFFSHFFGKLHIHMARLHMTVGGKDAAQVALSYGVMTNAMGALMVLLQKICDVESLSKADIDVRPDFTAETTTVDCCITFRMSLGNVLWAAIKAGWHFLFGYLRIKPDAPDEKKHKGEKKKVATSSDNHEGENTAYIGHLPLPPRPPKPSPPSKP